MRFSPLLLLAQAALGTAFLLPPVFSDADLKAFNLPGMHPSVSNIVRLPCTGCSYKDAGVETDLILEFAEGPAGTAVTLNNHALLPPQMHTIPTPFKAAQIPRNVDTLVYIFDKSHFPTVQFDNRLMIGEHRSADGRKEFRIELSIPAVNQKKVKLNDVKLTVFEDANGHFEFGTSAIVPHSQTCGMNVKCMMKQMMTKLPRPSLPARLRRPCSKHAHHGSHHMRPMHHSGVKQPNPHHPHTPHYSHRPHPNESNSPAIFHRIAYQVGLPILVGILVGMSVSLIGLIIGHIFVMIWRRIRGTNNADGTKKCGGGFFGRRRRERRERARLAAMEQGEESAKGLLTEEEVEAPPAYKDDEVVDEEKGVEGLEVVVEKD